MSGLQYSALFAATLLFVGCALKTGGTQLIGADGSDTVDDLRDMDSIWDGEVPETCGNGEVETPEECDDGNDVSGDGCENDCMFSCRENGDCRDGDICNGEEQCGEDHACEDGDPLPDGVVCGDDPRSICFGHACVESQCGDGFVDEGGGEFCDPPGVDNCNPDCTLWCEDHMDCPSDGNPCNGDERCNLGTHICDRTDPLTDGMTCNADPRMICIGRICQESLCGDGFIDSGRAPPEECEDMNVIEGDGCDNDCTFSCEYDWECDDDDLCNGEETCDDGGSHMCEEGVDAGEGTPCDDELFCTAVDECDGHGECTGSDTPCSGSLSCAITRCDEDANECVSDDVEPGFCLIGDVCYANGDYNPDNLCQVCISEENPEGWRRRPDKEACTDPSGTNPGICCEGVCRLGGDCCDRHDCDGSCGGVALPCGTFLNSTNCNAQDDCSWASATDSFCTGSRMCSDIRSDDGEDCSDCGCGGCSGDPCDCTGGEPSIPCHDFGSRDDCRECECRWVSSGDDYCSGEPTPCSEIEGAIACFAQKNCLWTDMYCNDYRCAPYVEE